MSGPNPNSNGGGGRKGGRGGGGGSSSGGGGRGRGGGRGGGRRGRGSGGGGRRSSQQNRPNGAGQQQQQQQLGDVAPPAGSEGSVNTGPQYRDEEVLIAFMPYLKADDPRAIAIHETYQSSNDSRTFLKLTREFLSDRASGVADPPPPTQQQPVSAPAPAPSAWQSPPGQFQPTNPLLGNNGAPLLGPTPGTTTPVSMSRTPIQSPMRPPIGFPSNNNNNNGQSLTTTPNSTMSATSQQQQQQHMHHLNQQQQHSSSNSSPVPPQYGSRGPGPGPGNNSSFQMSPHGLPQPNNNNHHNRMMPPPPPPPTPQQQQGGGSRMPHPFGNNGFPMNPNHQQQQHQQQGNQNNPNSNRTMMSPQQQQQQQYPMRQNSQPQQQQQPLNMMESLEQQLDRLIGGDDNDTNPLAGPPVPSLMMPGAIGSSNPRNNGVGSLGSSNEQQQQQQQHDANTSFLASLMSSPPSNNDNGNRSNNAVGEFNQLPPGPKPMQPQQMQQLLQQQQQHHYRLAQQQQQQQQRQRQAHSPGNILPPNPGGGMTMTSPPGSSSLMSPASRSPALSEPSTAPRPPSSLALSQGSTPRQLSPAMGPQATPTQLPPPTTATKTPRKDFLQQKRMWTNIDEQPGRVTVNDVNVSDPHVVLDVRPRKELKAKWMISWKYLQQRAEEMAKRRSESTNAADGQDLLTRSRDENPMHRLLPILRVGLFRRGCAENGAQASIISKSVMVSGGGGRPPFLDNQNQMVVGTVPFYSPRTPGHVVFRLYWDDEPLYTLGVGPTLHVRVMEDDYEGTIRFLLSNMKKKVNPTSLSSLHSLAQVLETSLKPPNQHSRGGRQQQQQQQQSTDHRAGRATWGCICEARKVLDACAAEYAKTSQRLSKLATVVDELKAELEAEEEARKQEKAEKAEQSDAANGEAGGKFDDADEDASRAAKTDEQQEKENERIQVLREKTRALMSGRASCERKWRDSQLAFASILKAVVANPSMPMLLRQDMIQKMRLEYELWCPLCEEFSVIGSNGESASSSMQVSSEGEGDATAQVDMWYDKLKSFPPLLTTEHVRICQESRAQMQLKTLCFVPNTKPLSEILFARQSSGGKVPTTMSPSSVAVLNQLSGAMGKVFQDVFTPEVEQRVNQQRESIRSQLEALVQQCASFPPGTKVVIFGSSANGFGTPQSDLDMCLQLPQGVLLGDDENDPNGSQAMAKLAERMEEQAALTDPASGFVITDVDSARLTARIPIIMFRCPIVTEEGTDDFMECDLSMHNPLAVMNTRFLRTYADINPVTRVMAFIIKRWAKARDINNPARHTLSSYGYIIMLLHYLTYHQRAGNGLTAPIAGPEGKPLRQNSQAKPLLPNLLWMDSNWPKEKIGTPYREMPSRPKSIMKHPMEKVSVNTYFYRPSTQAELDAVVRLFPGQDLSLAILLTSFFRYFAFEFDYKRFVVSLHSTASRGLVEREVKAELDGWRHYSAALTIEDPFETFYDVAHVLRGGYYHRIRREFAVAYSKIADVVSGNKNSAWTDANGEKIDPCSMSGMDLIDWICEPVAIAGTPEAS